MAHSHEHSSQCSCDTHEHKSQHNTNDSCGCGHEHATIGKEGNKDIIRLVVGILLFAAAIIISKIWELPFWAELSIFLAAYLTLGFQVLKTAGKNILKGKVFDENFLMTIATVGALILGDYIEGTAVMLFYLIGETLSDMAVSKSRKSITELMDIRPDYANIEKDGTIIKVAPQTIQKGDIIIVKPYEKVPLDGTVVSGISAMNTSALTGESVPRDVAENSEVLAGFVNGEGLIQVKVEKLFNESTASKILKIVEQTNSSKAPAEKFITKFARYYTPIVCAAALCVGVIPSLITGDVNTWVYRALLFLVISCPCALVVSVPLTYFGGIGGASKKGILVKGANYLEALTQVNTVVFDKTGTLTKGVFEVKEVHPIKGVSEEELLRLASIAEANSSHPIAKSVQAAYPQALNTEQISDYKDIAGHGISVNYGQDKILAGNSRLMDLEKISYRPLEHAGTILYVAKNGTFMGSILISDTIKPEAAKAVSELKSMGIHSVMLTGDVENIGRQTADAIGIDKAYFELLPQDKYSMLEKIEQENKGVAFAGDGINDAPALAKADVGIAMGAMGSDAAIEAADVVLMTDELMQIPKAIHISKKTRKIVLQNIIFALSVKSVVMVLGVMGIANMWAAVFADVGVTLIAVVNALRALKS